MPPDSATQRTLSDHVLPPWSAEAARANNAPSSAPATDAAGTRASAPPPQLGRRHTYATSKHAPPTSLIFFSASLLKNLALTTIGCFGRSPFPNTLK